VGSPLCVDSGTFKNRKGSVMIETFDFGDGKGPVPAHRHQNPGGWFGGWVANTAKVADSVYLGPDAKVYGHAVVSSLVQIQENAQVFGTARIGGAAILEDHVKVFGSASISGSSRVGGYVQISGCASLSDSSTVDGHAQISGDVLLLGNARVSGEAQVSGSTVLSFNTFVTDTARIHLPGTITIAGLTIGNNALVVVPEDLVFGRHPKGMWCVYRCSDGTVGASREKDVPFAFLKLMEGFLSGVPHPSEDVGRVKEALLKHPTMVEELLPQLFLRIC